MTKVEIMREVREVPEIKKKNFVSKYVGNDKVIRVRKHVGTDVVEKIENYSRDIVDVCEWYKDGKIKSYRGNGIYVDTIMYAEWDNNGVLRHLFANNDDGSEDLKLIYRVEKDADNNIINMASFIDKDDSFDIKYEDKYNFQILKPLETVTFKDTDVKIYIHERDWFHVCVYTEPTLVLIKEYIKKCRRELKNSQDFIDEYEPFAKKRSEKLLQKYLKLVESGEKEEYKYTQVPKYIFLPRYKYRWCKNNRKTVIPIDDD
jgi:hypothetical protein